MIDRNVPEGNVDGHGAEEQAHAAGDSLGPGERTARRRVHDGHPDVFVPETGGRSGLENVPDEEKQIGLKQVGFKEMKEKGVRLT